MSRVSCVSCVRTAAAILFSMRKKRPAEEISAGEKAFQNITNITKVFVKKDASGNPLANCFDKISIQPSLYICILRSIQSSSKHMWASYPSVKSDVPGSAASETRRGVMPLTFPQSHPQNILQLTFLVCTFSKNPYCKFQPWGTWTGLYSYSQISLASMRHALFGFTMIIGTSLLRQSIAHWKTHFPRGGMNRPLNSSAESLTILSTQM